MEDVSILNAKELITLSSSQEKAHTGKEMRELGIIEGASIGIKDGKISYIGEPKPAKKEIDASEKVVMPGFVDPHTHLVFAGSRADEFELRTLGKSYKEIAELGGGIANTVKSTRDTGEEELFRQAMKKLDYALSQGTTTIEIKSGYGLSLKDEIKMLRVIESLNKKHPISVVPTFLGAHSVPSESSKEKYMDELLRMMIPASKLAKFCDVFCEQGIFTKEESRKILACGLKFGLRPKIHADELSSSGGSELAGEIGAISAEHLVYPSDKGIELMKKAGTIAVLLPGACLFLSHKPPVKKFMDAGIPIAIGSDFNPGSSPVLSMPVIIGLACILLGISPAEAITAATINAAYALGIGDRVGSLESGKDADILILNVGSYQEVPYWFGFNPVDIVIKKGEVVKVQNLG